MSQQQIKVASFGAGVDSVAGFLKFGFDQYDEIVFSDTGSEKFQTYEYLAWLINQKAWPITVLSSKYGNIYDYYYRKKLYPNMFRRDCSGKFKIDVIHKYLRTKYGTDAHFTTSLYIDYHELGRMRESKYRYESLVYPLIDNKIHRNEAICIILRNGFDVPVKSGCSFCPFTKSQPAIKDDDVKYIMENANVSREVAVDALTKANGGWVWLRDNNPEEFKMASELEQISTLKKKREFPLISLKGHESATLEDTMQECGCFNG